VCLLGYLVLHELVHGLFMKVYSSGKVRFGFIGYAAYAAGEGYFNKREYIVIAFAPVVLFGIVLTALQIILPREWFWDIFFLQIMNITTSVGDFYITALMGRIPADILVKEEGKRLTIYARQAND
jgi:hypothetical protein